MNATSKYSNSRHRSSRRSNGRLIATAVFMTAFLLATPTYATFGPSDEEKDAACKTAKKHRKAADAASTKAEEPLLTKKNKAKLLATESEELEKALAAIERCRDPIDTNFREKFEVKIPTINTLLATVTPPSSTFDRVAAKYFSNGAELIGYERAVNTTTERMLGARVLHEPAFAALQFGILMPYRLRLGYLYALDIRLSGELAGAMTEIGLDQKLTEQDVAHFVAVLDKTGLPAEEIPMLKELGATDSDILDITASLYSSLQGGVAGFSVPDLLTDEDSRSNSVKLTKFLAGNCAPIALVKASLGLASDRPGFIAEADVNHDGKVDSADFAFATSQLPAGTVCP